MICHHTALEMRLDLLGEYHEDVAISLNNIGALFSTMKQYDMAVDFYGKALSVINVILGNNTMRFATTLSNIAIVYYRQQNYLSAIDYLDAALKVYIQYPNYAEKEIGTLAKLEKRCYEMLLAGDTLSEEGRAEAQKDYEQLLKDYESYLEHE
jgi:tetratricopeptide (TPR) repeat protein